MMFKLLVTLAAADTLEETLSIQHLANGLNLLEFSYDFTLAQDAAQDTFPQQFTALPVTSLETHLV